MKKRHFPVLLIFLSVLTLLFSGCDLDSVTVINTDGSKIEADLQSGKISVGEIDPTIPEYHMPVGDYINMLNAQNSSASNNTNGDTDEDNAEDISEDFGLPEESDLNDASYITDSDSGNEVIEETPQVVDSGLTVSEDGEYTSKEEVALYIHLYNHLPDNFITKKEAQDLGWDSSKGNLNKVAPGKSIGGDKFGNREGLLPEKEGRVYYECDIDYKKGSRNAKRIVFSNDGLIYYTEDHYESYELLYE